MSRGETASSRSPGTGRQIAAATPSAPSRGLFHERLIPTAHAGGLLSFALRARETSLRSRYADPREFPGIGNPATSKSRARSQARLTRRGPAESKLVLRATGPKAPSVNLGDDVIVKDLDVLGGTPVFRGTRVPFQALLDYLEGGQTLDEFIDDFPTVTREAAISALELAKSVLVGQLG